MANSVSLPKHYDNEYGLLFFSKNKRQQLLLFLISCKKDTQYLW